MLKLAILLSVLQHSQPHLSATNPRPFSTDKESPVLFPVFCFSKYKKKIVMQVAHPQQQRQQNDMIRIVMIW
jgi:hypothetical protein